MLLHRAEQLQKSAGGKCVHRPGIVVLRLFLRKTKNSLETELLLHKSRVNQLRMYRKKTNRLSRGKAARRPIDLEPKSSDNLCT